jgi:predicted nucleic acid-binding Zn ribbon protein
MEVLKEWDGLVGESIARVTHALTVREATLIVEVKSSAWLMELSFMKGDILRRLNEGREEAPIEKIVFVLSEQ